MGDINQSIWVKKNKNLVKGPILEIGSKFYDKTTFINYREIFPVSDYFGIDMSQGGNVDAVVNITDNLDEIRQAIKRKTFQTIICCSVLEHVDNIFQAARNITSLVEPNGVIFISVPFIWEEHGYPNDYWRLTPNAVRYLFPEFEFIEESSSISSNITGDYQTLNTGINSFIQEDIIFHANSEISSSLTRKFKRMMLFLRNPNFRKQYFTRKIHGNNNFFKKCSINMVGLKREIKNED